MKKFSAILLPFLCYAASVAGQENFPDTILKKFDNFRKKTLQEKIYAHLDRNFYVTGETLWFKIYVVDGSFHKPLDVSKVAYAEILDATNFPVLQAKIELKKGRGNGSFYLPASLGSGNYRLRLYTNWMKNFSPEFYFDKVITVVNPFVPTDQSPAARAQDCSVDFFPEGGDLVAGIESKVAFRIWNGSGEERHCNGLILNNRGDTVAAFSPSRSGLGHFLFTPFPGETYKALLIDHGKTTVHAFPEVHESGYAMQLRDNTDVLEITVHAKGMNDRHVFLFSHARQIVAVAERRELENNTASFLIKKSALPEGISHLTIFNGELKPVCERLYFNPPRKRLAIDVRSNAMVYNLRKKVSLTLTTLADDGQPLPANLSVSVARVDSLSRGIPSGIYSYLWLTSDLPGIIAHPESYLAGNTTETRDAVDNLMLTHGWRRFDWAEVLADTTRYVHLPEVNGHIINGVVMRSGARQPSVFTYLGSPGKIIRTYGSWSNKNGEVRFDIKDFYGSRRIIIQTKPDSAGAHEVKILNPFSESMNKEKLPPLVLDKTMARDLVARSISMQVQDIYYNEQTRNLATEPIIDSTAFYGTADDTYLLDDYTRFPVMEEVMREYVPGVFVRKRRDGFHFLVIDEVNKGLLPGDPMILVDGIPVFDVDDVMKMDPLRVQKLEVVKRQYYLGQALFWGIVSYSTYNGDLGDLSLNPNSLSINYDGLQLQREFYSPKHDDGGTNSRMPDQRQLLHWAPEVITGPDGSRKIEFYTSDVAGTYRVVVEGLNDEGYSGTKIYNFTVKAPDTP